jgi:hypothetical protein
MKKNIIISMLFLAAIIFTSTQLISNPTGAPQAAAGDPSSGGATCSQGGCHNGTPTTVSNVITTDIPAAGYIAGTTYNITVTVTGTGSKGFMLSPQNSAGAYLGTLISGSGSKLTLSKYITHSTDKSSSPAVWTFQWKAPVSGTGDVTFYGAFAISRNTTQKQVLTIHENTTGILPPVVSTLSSNNITATSATFNGTINTNGHPYSASFQYKTPTSAWVTVNAMPSTINSTSAIAVSYSVTNLPANTLISYKACAWNPGDTTWGAVQTFTTLTTTGLQNVQTLSSLSVYPNPVLDNLTISFNLNEKSDVKINLISIDGKDIHELYKCNLSSGNQELKLDVNDVKPGVYLLQMQVNDNTSFEKLMIN